MQSSEPSSSHSKTLPDSAPDTGEVFLQFRRKVQDSQLLSAATEKLLRALYYTGKLTVVLQNGQILKTGYEEGYFRRSNDLGF